jgi:hypothetical protein
MKSSILLIVGLALTCAAFMPATCKAQSEIAPDHFELTNVEPFTRAASTTTANHDPEQKKMDSRTETTYDQIYSSLRTSEKDKPKEAHLQFNFLGFPIEIDACKHSEIARLWKRAQAVERLWKQIGAQLNDFLFGEEAVRFLSKPSDSNPEPAPEPII